MSYPNQISGDSTPLKGFPNKYELQGGWTIPSYDLAFLTNGPLASEGRTEILVPAINRWKRALIIIKNTGIIIGAIIAIIGACIRWWPELSSIF